MAVTLDTLKKSIGKKKVKSMAFAWLADYENMAGDAATAIARVDAGLQLYPGDIPGMLVRSKLLFQKGEFDECVKECERILEKEPFCLSALKRMGEAYEQMGNVNERNSCYRRVHDMDPLDTFWKEEYEAMPEAASADMAAGAVAGAVGEAAAESEFAMPDMGEFTMDTSTESAEPAVEAPAADAAATEGAAESKEDSLFSKSLDMDIESPATEAATESATEEPEQPKAYVSPFSATADDDDPFAALNALGNDDALADESSIDTLQQSLESALGDAATDISLDQEIPEGEEISGTDVGSAFANLFGEEDDLDSFGDTAEQKPASPFAQMDLPTSLDDEPAATTEDSAKNVFGEETVEDKPQSIDDAFGDIFGEDELPEELPSNTAAPKVEPAEELKPEEDSFSGGMFEKSAAADMGLGAEEDDLKLEEPEPEQQADKPQSLDSAFADIFGEDELPEELPPAQPAGNSDASADLELPAEDAALELPAEDAPAADLELPAEETDSLDLPADLSLEEEEKPAEEVADLELPADDAGLELPTVDDSTSALTDDLDLEMPSEEKPAEETPAESLDTFDISNWSPDAKPVEEAPAEEPALDMPAEEPALEMPAEEEVPSEVVETAEPAAEDAGLELPAEESLEPAVEQPAEELPAEEPALDMPAEEPALEEPAQEEAPAEVAETAEPAAEEVAAPEEAADSEDVGFSVDKAFDALFADDDELPEEKPAATVDAEPEVTDNVSETVESVAEVAESDSDKSDLNKEMDSAFASLFADDDDLPVEENKPEATADVPTQEDTAAAIEEAPLAEAALESDLDKSFSSLFGEDDALDEADLKPADAPAEPVEEQPEVAATADAPADTATNAAVDSSLESEFSGAFKQLFNTDDDSLDEKADIPSNKGVDFLMSGDSDDEVSAGLVANPMASFDQQRADLDEGMKTPTLGEIYFEQGHYDKALDIYQDLARKEPDNEAIRKRLEEIETAYRTKFGENNNG